MISVWSAHQALGLCEGSRCLELAPNFVGHPNPPSSNRFELGHTGILSERTEPGQPACGSDLGTEEIAESARLSSCELESPEDPLNLLFASEGFLTFFFLFLFDLRLGFRAAMYYLGGSLKKFQ